MANLGRALMAGLVAGGAKYADMKLDEMQKAEQAERDKKLLELQQKVMEANERFKASLKAPEYQTVEDTDDQGRTTKRTIRSSYDPKVQGFTETEVGTAILPEKDGRTAFEVEAAYAEANPEKYAAMKAAGRKPSGGGNGGSAEKLPKATSLTEAQIDALFSTTNELGEAVRDTDQYRNFVAFQTRNAQKDPKYRDANFAVQQWANQVGFDPNEKPAGTFTLDEVDAPLMGSAKPAKADAKDKPADLPPGARQAPDGKWYVQKDGQWFRVN